MSGRLRDDDFDVTEPKQTAEKDMIGRGAAKNTALLVTDMQDVFLDPVSPLSCPGPELIPSLRRLVQFCRAHGVEVIFTAHVLPAVPAPIGELGRRYPFLAQSDWLRAAHPGTRITAELSLLPHELLVRKPQYSTFYETALDQYLHARDIGSLLVAGISTNVCCLYTAVDAFHRGYQVRLVGDATAAGWVTLEEGQARESVSVQRLVLADFSQHFGDVVSVAEVEQEYRSQSPLRAGPDWPAPGFLDLSARLASGSGGTRWASDLELMPLDWKADLPEVLRRLREHGGSGVSVYLDFDCPFNVLLDPHLPASPLAEVTSAEPALVEEYLSLRRTASAGLREGRPPEVPELLRGLAGLTGRTAERRGQDGPTS
jgi:nicotinamidase-related amidase